MQKFLPITYKDHWQSVRESDEAVGVKYDCKG
jgi:phosphonate transport system substrate-binding protein